MSFLEITGLVVALLTASLGLDHITNGSTYPERLFGTIGMTFGIMMALWWLGVLS